MIKTLLVPFVGLKDDLNALKTAFAVARLFDGHIECVHIEPSSLRLAVKAIPVSGESGMNVGAALMDRWKKLQKESKKHAESVHRSFTEFCRRQKVTLADRPGTIGEVSAAWRSLEGDQLHEILRRARLHDLTVVGRAPSSGHFTSENIGELLFRSGRPILLASRKAPTALANKVAIAWKDTPEAARAVLAAMPFLRKAKAVVIFAASEGGGDRDTANESAKGLAAGLAWHGINAKVQRVRRGKTSVAEELLAAAVAHSSDLLVMGAYGHSRTREFVLGGVTREVLAAAPLPVLLFH